MFFEVEKQLIIFVYSQMHNCYSQVPTLALGGSEGCYTVLLPFCSQLTAGIEAWGRLEKREERRDGEGQVGRKGTQVEVN